MKSETHSDIPLYQNEYRNIVVKRTVSYIYMSIPI